MELKFIINDYVLIWNLLFQPSYNDDINKLKMKLWTEYKKEYNDLKSTTYHLSDLSWLYGN